VSSPTPIEDYLDELLRRTRADARTTRRLLDEAGDHLHTTASELEAGGLARLDAEAEAVRRYGPVAPIVRATGRQSFVALVAETFRAAVLLGSCGLIAVGISGLVALVMNVSFGPSFVGATNGSPFSGGSVDETAHDAVVLRVVAGLIGLFVLLGYFALRRRITSAPMLPAGLVDALGAAAFAAGTVGLAILSADRVAQTGTRGVGFTLSGAVVALPATVYFCVRAARNLLASPAQAASHPD
jgi:hypothetical protein